jgi:hypothetical protein
VGTVTPKAYRNSTSAALTPSGLRAALETVRAYHRDLLPGSKAKGYCSVCDALDELADAVAALERIIEVQPRMIETLRSNGIVFDDLDEHWQKVAFTIYNELCEIDRDARAALEAR